MYLALLELLSMPLIICSTVPTSHLPKRAYWLPTAGVWLPLETMYTQVKLHCWFVLVLVLIFNRKEWRLFNPCRHRHRRRMERTGEVGKEKSLHFTRAILVWRCGKRKTNLTPACDPHASTEFSHSSLPSHFFRFTHLRRFLNILLFP